GFGGPFEAPHDVGCKVPLVPPALAFATGIALHAALPVAGWWGAWAGAVAVAAVFLAAGWLGNALLAIAAATLALGALRAAPAPLPAEHPVHLALPVIARVEGRVVAHPVRFARGRQRLVLDVDRVDGAARSGLLQLTVYGRAPHLAEGQRIGARARLRAASGFRNPGGLDYAEFLERQGLHVVASASGADVEALDAERRWHARVRRRAIASIEATLPATSGALLTGLLLGSRGELPPEILDGFRRAGVYHVLAVSGFNVALVALSVFTAALVATTSRRVAAVVAIVSVIGFAAVVGPEPSVVRAAIMGVLVLAALLLERDASVLNSLALAAITILAVRPADLFDPGFQLSFAATTGIVLAPLPRAIIASVIGVSLAAQLAVLPIGLVHFNQVSLIGVVANLGVVPLAGVATILGLAAATVAPLSATLGSWLFDATWPVLLAMRAIVHVAAAVPGALVHLPAPHWTGVVTYVSALALALWTWRARARIPRRLLVSGAAAGMSLLALSAAIEAWPIVRPAGDRLRVTVLDVGQGDAIVVETPDRRTMVIDAGAGGGGRFDIGERVVAPYLWNRGVRSIDAMVVTHGDNDHAGGIPSLRRLFPVRETLGGSTAVRHLGPVAVSVLGVTARPGTGHEQLVTRLEYGLATFLFASDGDRADELALLAGRSDLRATVLKVGHHGSAEASSAEFLAAARPTVAVISVGGRNAHGQPGPETLARLRAVRARVYRTDRDGAVILETDGRVLDVTAWSDRRTARFCLDPEAWPPC
ncbi:MAG: DNA internalization-related competence protein ComEC/Rec2, partial [Candidatus Rokubacteria bacterium]|nr:DNA internalization-related competence protein ComEC/Rec2 [Candidatus Rokubacteria bacterium]